MYIQLRSRPNVGEFPRGLKFNQFRDQYLSLESVVRSAAFYRMRYRHYLEYHQMEDPNGQTAIHQSA